MPLSAPSAEPAPPPLTEEMEQISAAASHELRDGLREALLHCEALRQTEVQESQHLIQGIETHIRSTLEYVAALRQYAYLCQDSEKTSLTALESVLQQAKSQLTGTIGWDARHLPVLACKPKQLALLFFHLFDNGLRHNHHPHPQIRVDYRRTAHFHQIDVSDNGVGMEPEYARLVFGLFKRIDPQNGRCGAGLAIAQKIAANHGGTLALVPEPGQGCRLTLTLPA